MPIGTFERLGRLPRPLQLPAAALAGLAFPVCECGSVPVARRLAQRGLDAVRGGHVHARRPDHQSGRDRVDVRRLPGPRHRCGRWCCGRFRWGCSSRSRSAGWSGSRTADELLQAAPSEEREHLTSSPGPRRAGGGSSCHLGSDFLFMARFLILGAAIAAAIQTFVPAIDRRRRRGRPGASSILAMMALAFALSLCSESDAFVAASFVPVRALGAARVPRVRADGRPKLAALYVGHVPPRVRRAPSSWRSSPRPSSARCGSGCSRDERHAHGGARGGACAGARCASRAPVVLGAWAGSSGSCSLRARSSLYLSTRTDWVVPVGAVLLTLAAIGRLATARAAHTEPLGAASLGARMIAMVVPVLLSRPSAGDARHRSRPAGARPSPARARRAGDIATGELDARRRRGGPETPEGERALASARRRDGRRSTGS